MAIQEYEKRFEGNIFASIIKAIDAIIEGKHNNQFVIPLKQGGAGTSINFNFDEVISGLTKDVHKKKYNAEISVDPVEDINLFNQLTTLSLHL